MQVIRWIHVGSQQVHGLQPAFGIFLACYVFRHSAELAYCNLLVSIHSNRETNRAIYHRRTRREVVSATRHFQGRFRLVPLIHFQPKYQ